jgi:hypothetical protein
MNELIDHKIKIEFTEREIEHIVNSLGLDYQALIDREDYMLDNARDLNLGLRIFMKAKRTLNERLMKYQFEGIPNKRKPIKVSLTKLDILWLHNYLSMAELVELEYRRIDMGKWIADFIK